MKKFIWPLAVIALFFSLAGNANARTLDFSGYSWQVRGDIGGPGPNTWGSAENEVFMDSLGRLHLTVSAQNGAWHSTEVYLNKSLGYGQYIFDIDSAVDKLDTNLVAAPFLYQDDTHELDIEYSYWQIPKSPNLHYSVQPYSTKGNNKGFTVALANTTTRNIIDWQPNKVVFSTLQSGQTIASYDYTGSDNFSPGKERVHINFWQINGVPPLNLAHNEFIVKSFTFVPYVSSSVSSTTSTPTTTPAVKPTPVKKPPVVTKPKPKTPATPAKKTVAPTVKQPTKTKAVVAPAKKVKAKTPVTAKINKK